jgi:hypothetical protein
MSAIQHKPPVQDSSDSLSMLDIEFVFKNRWIRVTAAIGLTFILCLIFVIGAEQQGEEVNTDISASDQYAYIHYAQNLANSSWNYEGDGNRMPLYPSIMAVFFRADMTDDSFFELGKKIGIVIALVVIAEAFLIFRRVASLCDALAATLVSAFTVFAYKAPYFQADVMFYGLGALLFVLLLSLIRKPGVGKATVGGLVAGLAHLTKASVLPAVALAVFCLLVVPFFKAMKKLLSSRSQAALPLRTSPSVSRSILSAAVLAGCYLLVISPHLMASKQRYGYYFYNVNSTFYVWCDSWDEVSNGPKAHGDRIGWPDMPADEIPSFRKYFREHSASAIELRITHGLKATWLSVVHSYGYAPFFAFYALAACGFLTTRETLVRMRSRAGELASQAFFISAYFLGYLLLYAWYSPIAGGNRFILSLFLPAFVLLLTGITYAKRQNARFGIRKLKLKPQMVSPVMTMALVFYLAVIYQNQIGRIFGGD